jgi:hypothetical protein
MDHTPHSPYLAPSNFHAFWGPLKKNLAGRLFETEADVKQAVTSWLQTLDNDFFCAGVQVLEPLETHD